MPNEMNQLQFERDRILTIVNNLADPVFSIDKHGKIELYNAAGSALLDTNADLNGKSLDEVFKLSDENGRPVKIFDSIKTAKSVVVDDSLRRMLPDNDEMRLEITYAPIRGAYDATGTHQTDGFIVIARDVTRLKSLEEERDEFISVVSHELRTPVTVAEGTLSNVQLMLERGINDKAKIDSSVDEAHKQVIYLAKMINDLSTLSRAERGVMGENEPIDVAELAHSLHHEYSPEAEEAGLHLNLSLGPKLGCVNTSRLYLHELLQNFITNSIKYTREGSVTLEIHNRRGQVDFAVSDTGIGISKSDQEKVFQKFFRSEDYRTRETGGTGLGLYVTTKLARKMGTTINLQSRLNHGSTFSFSLPAHESPTSN